MKKFLSIIGVVALTLGVGVLPAIATENQIFDEQNSFDSSRGLGEMVVINGIERPDLIDQFDLLKTKTVMIRGTVFAKDRDGNLVIPADVETETQAILAEAVEQEEEREKNLLAKSQTYTCPRCSNCGAKYCTGVTCTFCGTSGICLANGATHTCPPRPCSACGEGEDGDHGGDDCPSCDGVKPRCQSSCRSCS